MITATLETKFNSTMFNPDAIRGALWKYGELMHFYSREDVASIEANQLAWEVESKRLGVENE